MQVSHSIRSTSVHPFCPHESKKRLYVGCQPCWVQFLLTQSFVAHLHISKFPVFGAPVIISVSRSRVQWSHYRLLGKTEDKHKLLKCQIIQTKLSWKQWMIFLSSFFRASLCHERMLISKEQELLPHSAWNPWIYERTQIMPEYVLQQRLQ